MLGPVRAYAAGPASVLLGTAKSYSVLAGSTVTNTGDTVLGGDLGVSPGTAVTGFPPSRTLGTIHAADAAASQAQSDLTTAYNDAAGRSAGTALSGELGGQPPLVAGVYTASSAALLTGTLTLDGQTDPSSVFIFQIGSSLTTAVGSTVALVNGAQACNVFFQVGSSATLGVNSTFVGTILALTSVTVGSGATVEGRALARNGAVTLNDNTFTSSACVAASPGPSATPSVSVSPTLSASPSVTATESVSPSASATPSESSSPSATASESSTPSVTASPSTSVTVSQSSTPTVAITETGLLTEGPDVGATETEVDLETEGPSATGSTLEVGDTGRSGGGGLAQTGSSGLTTAVAVGGVALLLAAAGVLGAARIRSRMGGHE